jgi:hypothetical protein
MASATCFFRSYLVFPRPCHFPHRPVDGLDRLDQVRKGLIHRWQLRKPHRNHRRRHGLRIIARCHCHLATRCHVATIAIGTGGLVINKPRGRRLATGRCSKQQPSRGLRKGVPALADARRSRLGRHRPYVFAETGGMLSPVLSQIHSAGSERIPLLNGQRPVVIGHYRSALSPVSEQ